MKKDELFNAIGDVSDKHLLDEMPISTGQSRSAAILKIAASAAAIVLVFGTVAMLPRLIGNDLPHLSTIGTTDTTDAVTTDESVGGIPTEDEVIDAYNLALMKMTEFCGPSTLGSRYGDGSDTITVDGNSYVRVTKFEMWTDMEEYLLESFSRELTDSLIIENPYIVEHDGKVYSMAGDRGSHIAIGATHVSQIARAEGDDDLMIVISETSINDYADMTCVFAEGKIIATHLSKNKYELIDGKWVFTTFEYPEDIDLEPYQGITLKTEEAQKNMIEIRGFKLYLNPMYMEYIMFKNDVYEDALVTIYYKPQHEKDGQGEILTIYRYTPGEYERRVLGGNIVGNLRALGTDGEYYYVIGVHTDVTADPTDGTFWAVNNSAWELVTKTFAEINQLQPIITRDFYEQLFTYEGEHKFVKYYPYGKDVNPDIYYCIVLSQPATQGDGGIWCVERWYDSSLTLHPHFPDSGDIASKKYYEYVQEAYDEGKFEEYGDPEAVVISFVKETFGFDVSFGTHLEYIDSLPEGNYSY